MSNPTSEKETRLLFKARNLDTKGRCCGRKPIRYKRDGGPHLFCPRCSRAYDVKSGRQIENWAYRPYENDPNTFVVKFTHMAERAAQ